MTCSFFLLNGYIDFKRRFVFDQYRIVSSVFNNES